jgi:hypothetical protein
MGSINVYPERPICTTYQDKSMDQTVTVAFGGESEREVKLSRNRK